MLQAPIHSDLKADVLDKSPVIIAVHDTEHHIVWANRAYFIATGRSLQEVEGKKCYSVWRLDKPCRGCPVTLAIEAGEPHEAELTPQNQDHWPISQGSWLSKSTPLKDAEGRIIGAVEVVYDITERKRLEEVLAQVNGELVERIEERTGELIESREMLDHAFALSPIGQALVAPDGRFLKANATLCRILGYSERELLTKTFQDLSHPDDLDADLANVQQVLAGEIETYEMEKRYLHGEGHLVWAQLNVSLVRDGARQPNFFIAQIQDITRRKQAEQALKETVERFDLLTSQLSDVVWSATVDGSRLLYLNHAIEKVFGISEEAFRSNPGLWLEMVHPDDRAIAEASHQELFATGQGQAEYRIVRPDGEARWILDRKAIVNNAEGQPLQIGGVARDITDTTNMDREKETLQAQLFQAQKMEAVGRLAGGVAHDYNNMLSVILGYTEMALNKLDRENSIYEDLEEVLAAARRSAEITRQLLAFARKQTISPKVLDLNDAVESMLNMLRRLIGEDINLAWSPSEGLWPVKIDPTQVDQILANLCVNARDAIVDVGKITIETKNVVFDEAYCANHRGFTPGEYIQLAISDDGCGIDREILDHIFEPFFTTKELGKGTGLGLATVYGIVKQNGGFINVYSEPGQGTSLHVYFSRHIGEATEILKESAVDIPYGHGETVLVVEDEVPVLKFTCKLLEELGYVVLTAGSPDMALSGRRACRHDKPAPDRCGDARNERQGSVRTAPVALPEPQVPVHVRLYGQRHCPSGHSGRRQALYP